MAFKFPSVKKKVDNPASLIIKDLPSFQWSDLTDKEEIGRGSFGSVFMAKYPAANGDDFTRVVILMHCQVFSYTAK